MARLRKLEGGRSECPTLSPLIQVVHEAARFYTPIGMVTRAAVAPYRVPGTVLILRPGDEVHIPSFAVHRSPEHYDTPGEFNPEHFRGVERLILDT